MPISAALVARLYFSKFIRIKLNLQIINIGKAMILIVILAICGGILFPLACVVDVIRKLSVKVIIISNVTLERHYQYIGNTHFIYRIILFRMAVSKTISE